MIRQKAHHPHLYEINTRVLLSRYKKGQSRATLSDIPDSFWDDLAGRGIDWVWLMGVWTLKEKKINPNLIPDHMMDEFKALLPDLTEDEIDGSTYAIDDYVVDPVIGGTDELIMVHNKLSGLGMCLMLDFIPNHYGAHTHFIHSHPEYFIEVDYNTYLSDKTTFYSPLTQGDFYFAHGKDPYFDAWQDTIQVNYGSETARMWMTEQLLKIAALCDGVRCDMAMLPKKSVFEKTWGDIVNWNGGEFWPDAIHTIKKTYPDFTLLAEVYWGLEAELLESGFDYCYDKTFFDRLTEPDSLNTHFHAENGYLRHTARFLENHDEERIAARFDLRQHAAAAAMVAFGPGMRFWHMGQWEGRAKKIPVQVTREPDESCGCLLIGTEAGSCGCLLTMYRSLFEIVNQDIFRFGNWTIIDPNADSKSGLLIWKWEYKEQKLIVAINYCSQEVVFDSTQSWLPGGAHLILPTTADSYNGTHLRPWDVRIWDTAVD